MERLTLEQYLTGIVLPAFGTTMRILFWTVLFSCTIGFILGIILNVTGKNGLRPNKVIFTILDTIINVIRSFPFLILLVSLVPLTRFVTGSAIGEKAAIFPLTISLSPAMARLFASHLDSVDHQLIEAARSFGASTLQIIWHVIIVEAIPGIISVISFSVVTGLSATAAAGTVGAGGLGSVAMRYGYQDFNDAIMYSTVAILVVLVQIFQLIGNAFYNRAKAK